VQLRRCSLPQLLHGLFFIDIGRVVDLACLLLLFGSHLPGEWICRYASLPLCPQIHHILLQCHLVLPLRVEALIESLLRLLGAEKPKWQMSGMGQVLLASQESEKVVSN
jgi:hypothetical protein